LKKRIFREVTGLAKVEKMPCTTEFNLFNLRLAQKMPKDENSLKTSE
jgi:hypothetical protein